MSDAIHLTCSPAWTQLQLASDLEQEKVAQPPRKQAQSAQEQSNRAVLTVAAQERSSRSVLAVPGRDRSVGAQEHSGRAGASARAAAGHAGQAGAYAAGAVVHAALATADVAVAGGRSAEAIGRLAVAGGLAVAGAVVRSAEEVAAGARAVAKAVARGLAGIANGLGRLVGDGGSIAVRERAPDLGSRRTSDRLFGAASRQLARSGEAAGAAWRASGSAAVHLAGSAVSAGLGVAHLGAFARAVAAAALHSGATAGAVLFELGAGRGR